MIFLAAPTWGLAQTTPFSIERSQVRIITSKDKTREYQLFIKTPRSYLSDTNKNYPLVFLNDGSYSFPLVSSITRQMSGGGVIEEPIIVGVSYDTNTSWKVSRTRDYTPTYSPNEENSHSDEARKHSGGADDYRLFIENELLPYLRKEFRINTQKEIYAGHSFGGLFGGFVLKTKPQIFDYYILSDPSFWYHNGSVFDIQRDPSSDDLNVLIFSQASKLGKGNVDQCKACMAQNARKFSQVLKQEWPKGLIEHVELEHEIHETVFPVAVSRGLHRFLSK